MATTGVMTLRNPKRIPVILDELRALWESHPDWRLGQLIVNLTRGCGLEYPFFVEDDPLLETIKNWNACTVRQEEAKHHGETQSQS